MVEINQDEREQIREEERRKRGSQMAVGRRLECHHTKRFQQGTYSFIYDLNIFLFILLVFFYSSFFIFVLQRKLSLILQLFFLIKINKLQFDCHTLIFVNIFSTCRNFCSLLILLFILYLIVIH